MKGYGSEIHKQQSFNIMQISDLFQSCFQNYQPRMYFTEELEDQNHE